MFNDIIRLLARNSPILEFTKIGEKEKSSQESFCCLTFISSTTYQVFFQVESVSEGLELTRLKGKLQRAFFAKWNFCMGEFL
jgi:hypothetical protein